MRDPVLGRASTIRARGEVSATAIRARIRVLVNLAAGAVAISVNTLMLAAADRFHLITASGCPDQRSAVGFMCLVAERMHNTSIDWTGFRWKRGIGYLGNAARNPRFTIPSARRYRPKRGDVKVPLLKCANVSKQSAISAMLTVQAWFRQHVRLQFFVSSDPVHTASPRHSRQLQLRSRKIVRDLYRTTTFRQCLLRGCR
jgi:hypothetical protein